MPRAHGAPMRPPPHTPAPPAPRAARTGRPWRTPAAALALAVALGGCTPPATPAVLLGLGDLASVATFHRGLFDLAFSGTTGRDCSIVRLDRGQTYCREKEAPPAPPPYCTRSLGTVDCWADPAAVPNLPREVADGPRTLTPAQERQRTARWPDL